MAPTGFAVEEVDAVPMPADAIGDLPVVVVTAPDAAVVIIPAVRIIGSIGGAGPYKSETRVRSPSVVGARAAHVTCAMPAIVATAPTVTVEAGTSRRAASTVAAFRLAARDAYLQRRRRAA